MRLALSNAAGMAAKVSGHFGARRSLIENGKT
jgi:hypothetical protein